MPPEQKKFYLTTPIYYVNARPHIGHAYTTIVADVLARRHRLLGDDTFFLTGTDEHGQKIERSASAAGIPPQQFADKVSAEFKALWDRMGLTYDDYIRTTEPRHAAGVQKLFTTLYERGYIYLDSYTGSYCVSDEAFVDAPAGTPCPDCGRLLETVTEENFFFKLSAFQQPLIELIEADTLAITPESRKNEVLSFVRGGLKDLSISRSSFTWGIPVPEPAASLAKQKHVIYVWLDALANYMTAVGYGSDEPKDIAEFERYWPADLHLVGKEIIRFHCVYWPAFLLAAGLPIPKAITAHGWLLFDNAKMSKSKGNIVRTETILEAFGEHVYAKQFPDSTKRERDLFAADVLRYFLLREIPFGQDGSFSFDALVTRYNADLANGYGNLVSRTLKLAETTFANGWIAPFLGWNIYGTNVERSSSPGGRGQQRCVVGSFSRSHPDSPRGLVARPDCCERAITNHVSSGTLTDGTSPSTSHGSLQRRHRDEAASWLKVLLHGCRSHPHHHGPALPNHSFRRREGLGPTRPRRHRTRRKERRTEQPRMGRPQTRHETRRTRPHLPPRTEGTGRHHVRHRREERTRHPRLAVLRRTANSAACRPQPARRSARAGAAHRGDRAPQLHQHRRLR